VEGSRRRNKVRMKGEPKARKGKRRTRGKKKEEMDRGAI
jgi:hypothetical protein